MARPRVYRNIKFNPITNYFKPRGIPLMHLEEVVLRREELEAIKLKDFDGLDQESASKKMNISQSTFQRILSLTRKKIAKAIVEGKALKIENDHNG